MYDVAIVGAGIGGSYLAAALKDLNVLTIEKNKNIRLKDSGVVSNRFMNFFPQKHLIKNRIREMNIISPDGKIIYIKNKTPFACILNRTHFSNYLRKRVDITYDTVKQISVTRTYTTIKTMKNIYRARMVVGADGAASVVRRSLGIPSPSLHFGLMTITRHIQQGPIKIFFNKYYSPEYFSWIIPQSNEYGIITKNRPNEYLKYFARQLNLSGGVLYAYPIPLGYTRSYSYRALLVGDACGQNKPITGGGIIFSMTAARYAESIIREAIEKDDFSLRMLARYETAWKNDFGKEIRNQLLFRKIYRRLTNADINKLFMEFGDYLSTLRDFDYDKFSKSWISMPKLKMLVFFLKNIPIIISSII